jgi:hypothetical protein
MATRRRGRWRRQHALPNAVGQRLELVARALSQVARHAVGELLIPGRGPGRVVSQRHGPHPGSRRRLVVRFQLQGFIGGFFGLWHPTGGERGFPQHDQHGGAACTPTHAFPSRPIFKGRGVVDGEPFQKIPAQKGGGIGRLAGREGGELQDVHVERVLVERDRVPVRQKAIGSEPGAQAPDRLVERMAGVALRLLGPEQSEQVIASAGAIGRQREIDEQAEMFAPQDVRRRLLPGEPCPRRPEAGQLEGRQVRRFGHGDQRYRS